MLRILIVAGVTLLMTGCTPGYSLNQISATPTGITYAYTYSVEGEYEATVKAAEQHCAVYGKHARPVGQPVKMDVDRAIATFDCVR